MRKRTIGAVLTAFFSLFSTPLLAQSAGVVELRPGLLIDVGGSRLLSMNPDGGVDALDIDTGDPLWHSDACDRPLALALGQLVCQRESTRNEELIVAALELADGSTIREFQTELPAGTRALVDDGQGVSFDITAIDPANPATVSWRFQRRTVQGMPTDNPPDLQVTSGSLVVDLVADTMLPGVAPAADIWNSPAQVEGRVFDAPAGRQFLSASGNYVLVSVADGDPGQRDRHGWTIHDREGLELGSTRSFVSYVPFAVVGRTLLFVTPPNTRMVGEEMVEEPLLLRAVSLDSGQERWQRTIRDTTFYGPFPW